MRASAVSYALKWITTHTPQEHHSARGVDHMNQGILMLDISLAYE